MITPVRGFTTKWSVSCIPYFTGDPSGSWPLRTNTSVPTFVDSESVRPAGYPFGSRIGGSFTLFAPGTTEEPVLAFNSSSRIGRGGIGYDWLVLSTVDISPESNLT